MALGYKGECVKDYFLNFYALNNDLTVDLCRGDTTVHRRHQPGWRVHLVDTGPHTETGGRIKRLREWIGEETFMLTYGAGVSDINIGERESVAFGQAFNIGGGPGTSLSVKELLSRLESEHGFPMQYSAGPPRPGDQKVFIADTAKARQTSAGVPQFQWRMAWVN